MIAIISNDKPESVLDQRLAALTAEEHGDCFAVEYPFCQYYLPGDPELQLLALYEIKSEGGDRSVRISVTDRVAEIKTAIAGGAAGFTELADAFNLAVMNTSAPLLLDTVAIAKPWGQEIWYTGIEERGQSSFVDDRGCSIPIAWLFSAAPSRLSANKERNINLLKILDPLPEEVYGDLYFELHEEKREVYVVTNIDASAWPEGSGAIRFGFNQEVRREYTSDDDFRRAYLAAVQSYEEIRREIDEIFDHERKKQGLALNEPVDAEQLKQWQQQLPESLQSEEAKRRAEMNRFTAVKSLNLGDVVKVPCFTPHALQHGVRTVEFQTPVYERKILAFAQKVLTQDHWDTPEAVELMDLDEPVEDKLEVVESGQHHQLERVVQFADFEVFRLSLAADSDWQFPASGEYGLLMKISGSVQSGGCSLADEQAQFLPAARQPLTIANTGQDDAVLLLAQPR